MSIKSNYHNHTIFCDGKNTAEEMVLSAIEHGFYAIGFSGHSHTAFDESYAMSHTTAKAYYHEITALKEKYRKKIEIYCGIEQDLYSDEDTLCWDYIIGSVHYICKNGEYIPVDESENILLEACKRLYNGDIYALVKDYYTAESSVTKVMNVDIIGHFDLITKFNEGEKLFSESDYRYISAYREALSELIKADVPFEINTGAMSRGYRSVPYPSKRILCDIYALGGKIAISGDSHECGTIDFAFDKAAELAKECGFNKISVIKCGKMTEEIL